MGLIGMIIVFVVGSIILSIIFYGPGSITESMIIYEIRETVTQSIGDVTKSFKQTKVFGPTNNQEFYDIHGRNPNIDEFYAIYDRVPTFEEFSYLYDRLPTEKEFRDIYGRNAGIFELIAIDQDKEKREKDNECSEKHGTKMAWDSKLNTCRQLLSAHGKVILIEP